MSDRPDLVALGMSVAFDGRLRELRESLNLSRTALAALMDVSPESLRKWESGQQGMKLGTAIRVAKWWMEAQRTLSDRLATDDAPELTQLIPIVSVVAHYGVSQQTVMKWCRDGEIDFEDLGVLGYFIYRDQLPNLPMKIADAA